MTIDGDLRLPQNTAFLSFLTATAEDVTGDDTALTFGVGAGLTEVYDIGGNITTSGIFTASATGKYNFSFNMLMNDFSACRGR